MTELETLMLDVTNTLNHNGFDEVKVVSNNVDFSVRVNYWEQLPASLIETMEEYHSIRITEYDWEDEDCGTLYRYLVEVVDEDTGYTLDELNDLDSNYEGDRGEAWFKRSSQGIEPEPPSKLDNYLEEAEFLDECGADDIWGVA